MRHGFPETEISVLLNVKVTRALYFLGLGLVNNTSMAFFFCPQKQSSSSLTSVTLKRIIDFNIKSKIPYLEQEGTSRIEISYHLISVFLMMIVTSAIELLEFSAKTWIN